MQASSLVICCTVALASGCASYSEAPESVQSSTTGTILVRTGYVSDVQDFTIHDHSRASAAPAVGALVGGIAGSMLGSGSGRVLGTLGGAAGGSLAAQQLARPETSSRKKVTVRFEDGTSQIYEVGSEEPFRVGEAVKIVNRSGNIQVLR